MTRGAPTSRSAVREPKRRRSAIAWLVPTDTVLAIDELAIYLKLPKRALHKQAQEGTIPFRSEVGRQRRSPRDRIDSWLNLEGPIDARASETT